jgi:NADH:ubiquinone oxidoreductase subunit 3 (subunit A)
MNNLGYAEFMIIFIVFVTIIAIFLFLAWFFVNRAKARDRQFLIEKGINADDPNLRSSSHFSLLKAGIIVVGIALSLFLVGILDRFASIGATAAFAIILLFAGSSMILANLIGKKDNGSK